MKRKSKLFFITCFTLTFCLIFTTFVHAANFATAIGSTVNNINTTNHINDAADAYDSCGYTGTRRLLDPSYLTLLSNLAAEVQFFATHGNVDNVTFNKSGIRVGTEATYGELEYIGTNNISTWANNTILVTYAGCYTAGDTNLDTNSITYVTAVKGAEATLGFKDEIFPSSLENWADRYNTKLANGYGVLDAADYASSFIYVYDSVKDYHVVHHGDANVKIGNYHTSTASLNTANSLEELSRNITLSKGEKNLVATDNNIVSLLKSKDNSFNENNYEIVRRTGGSTNVNTGNTAEIEYIDVKLKIGDFITNAGYTIKVDNEKITKVFDNNIDKEAQEIALKNKNEFLIKDNISISKLEELEKKAVKEVNNTSKNENIIVENKVSDTRYFYDIETGKKYVYMSVRTENHKDGSVGYAYDTVKYEL